MKVLQINCVYGRGSTGKIVQEIHELLLTEGYESIVCFGRQRGKIEYQVSVYKTATELEGDFWHAMNRYCGTLMYSGMWLATYKLISIIKREKPDVVNLHCINGYMVNVYNLLKFLGQNNIKTVVTNHAEFLYTGSCGHAYDCMRWSSNPGCGNCPILKEASGTNLIDKTAKAWLKMKEAYSYHSKDNLLFTAVSPWVKSRLKQSPITNYFDCVVIENGLNESIFHPYIREKGKDKPFVFHVTAIFSTEKNSLKGGWYIAELARRMPNLKFIVACGYLGKCEKIPSNLQLLGRVSDQQELAKLYSNATLTVISSKRETFSMVTAESLCCGTPVVGFKAGGPESIALKEYSTFVEYGDIDALQSAIEIALQTKYDCQAISKVARRRYSSVYMGHKYIDVYKQILK